MHPEPTLPPDHDPSEQPPLTNPVSPHLRQLALQCAAAFVVLSLAWPYFVLRNETLPWPATALAIGVVALLLALFTHQPWWWKTIHVLFAPLMWLVSTFSLAPGWFLFAFIVMLLIFRGALTDRIPLFLSNTQTALAISTLLPEASGMRFIDLGAGIGSIIRPLSKMRPDGKFSGIENAPATWLIGRIRTTGLTNITWLWGSLWKTNLGEYDVVYAFLSPEPMSDLWKKACQEMRSGTLFISNSFAVPEIEADQIIEIDDSRQTRLYCYRI